MEDTTPKNKFGLLSTLQDMEHHITCARLYTPSLEKTVCKACNFIYRKGYSLKYWGIEDLLKAESLSVTQIDSLHDNPYPSSFLIFQSAFVRLIPLGLDIYKMLVPNVLHKFKLGVWKVIVAHLI